jgi:hypothetical protein
VRVGERVYIENEADSLVPVQMRIGDVEVASRRGWEDAPISSQDEASQLDVAEPVIATTWFEEEIREAFLNIVDVESREVVTVIEILSPTNKIPNSPGLESFEQKRREVFYSPAHWVEIDLLRGKRVVGVPKKLGAQEYLVHVSKKGLRPRGLPYPIRLSQRLPVIAIPVKTGEVDVRLDLQAALDSAYDRAGYDLEIDYTAEASPALTGELAAWADGLLKSKGLRRD